MELKQQNYSQEPKIEEVSQVRIEDLQGLFKTSSAVPTHNPRKFSEQIVIYTSGSTYRFYWYDVTNATWHYVTATA